MPEYTVRATKEYGYSDHIEGARQYMAVNQSWSDDSPVWLSLSGLADSVGIE
jgi:hypothetical protein